MSRITINGNTYSGNSVIVTGDNVIIDGIRKSCKEDKKLVIHISEGSFGSLQSDRNIEVHGDINGNVKSGGPISCHNINGEKIESSGSVNCDGIQGAVKAGRSINCATIEIRT